MDKEVLLNDFATRSFRDVADRDYIAARLSYRHGLYPQFHWQSLQAIEKYLKAILLYNRIKATDIKHDLKKAIKYTNKLPFEILRSESTNNFIKHLSEIGSFRYFEASYAIHGPKLIELDKSVWEIRRYCTVLNHDIKLSDGTTKNMLELELNKIKNSVNKPPNKFRLIGGLLEKIVDTPKHTSRHALVWQNAFFSKVTRKSLRLPTPLHVENAPLYLHPEIIDEVSKLVFLPSGVANAYRELANSKK